MSWIYEAVKERGKEELERAQGDIETVRYTEDSFIVKLSEEMPLSTEEKVRLCEEIKHIDPDINLWCKVLRVDTRVFNHKEERESTAPGIFEDREETGVINSSGKGERAYPVEKEYEELPDPSTEKLLVLTKRGDVIFQRKGFGTTHLKRFTEGGKEESLKKILDKIASVYGLPAP